MVSHKQIPILRFFNVKVFSFTLTISVSRDVVRRQGLERKFNFKISRY